MIDIVRILDGGIRIAAEGCIAHAAKFVCIRRRHIYALWEVFCCFLVAAGGD